MCSVSSFDGVFHSISILGNTLRVQTISLVPFQIVTTFCMLLDSHQFSSRWVLCTYLFAASLYPTIRWTTDDSISGISTRINPLGLFHHETMGLRPAIETESQQLMRFVRRRWNALATEAIRLMSEGKQSTNQSCTNHTRINKLH